MKFLYEGLVDILIKLRKVPSSTVVILVHVTVRIFKYNFRKQ
jgi:hypothetical protein